MSNSVTKENINNSLTKPKTNSALDVAKFVLSFFVMAIHTENNFYPWLRIAVPLFFIISSYLFFKKVSGISDDKEKILALKKYVLRSLKLYAFWFVCLLPVTIYNMRGLFANGIFSGILTFIKMLIFGSTFAASWFITALVIAIVILFFASKKLSNIILIALTSLIFILILLSSTYNDFLPKNSILNSFFKYYELITENNGALSFPVALFWCMIGKLFAERKSTTKTSVAIIFIVVGIVLSYAEWKWVYIKTGATSHNQYLALAILCPALFALINGFNFYFPFSKYLRNASTIIYACHMSFCYIFSFILKQFNMREPILWFLLVAVVCLILSTVIILLSKKFKIFRYAY